MNKTNTSLQAAPNPGSGAMFDNLAHRYDLLNRLMSFGVDKRWRKRTVRSLSLSDGDTVLDLATGTADLAIDIAKRHKEVQVVGLDPSSKMLKVGETKLAKKKLSQRIELVEGIAEKLPFEDNRFDGLCMAFGIRNCTDRLKALREMNRVTRPGKRVAILELGEPRKGLMAPMARFHIHQVVPRLGALLSGRKEYRYLQESIEAFPPPEQFAEMMKEAGLDMVRVDSLSFGSCNLYVAQVKD